MSKRMIAAIAALAVSASGAWAQDVKVGIVLPYTGVNAEFAQQMQRGIDLYLKLNADQVKPYKITLIKRDSKNAGRRRRQGRGPGVAHPRQGRCARGLFVFARRDRRSAPLVTAGKKLAVIMNAGTAFITNLSPYFVRTSFSMWHAGYSMGEAAANILHAKTAVVAYTDYPPGKDSLASLQDVLRGQWRQGDRRHPGGRARRRSRLHAVLPARQGREAGRAVRVRAGRRSRRRRWSRLTPRSACAPPASS